jgi:hypothetical protein
VTVSLGWIQWHKRGSVEDGAQRGGGEMEDRSRSIDRRVEAKRESGGYSWQGGGVSDLGAMVGRGTPTTETTMT